MSNFDNFDIDQTSSYFAQIQYFVCNFHCKKFSIVGSLDDDENANLHFFIVHPISLLSMTLEDFPHSKTSIFDV